MTVGFGAQREDDEYIGRSDRLHDRRLVKCPKSSSARAVVGAGATIALLAAVLAGCGPPARPTPPPATTAVSAAPAEAGRHLVLDPARSALRVLAYRSGALARLGHNHVLIDRELAGDIWLAADGSGRVTLRFPVAAFSVDEPAARREEGAEFETVPSAADIEGTRHNLLGPRVLDALAHPEIRVEGDLAPGAATVRARVVVRGVGTALAVPVTLHWTDAGLEAEGGLTVRQSELGLEPFSVALGALQVRDELAVRFHLVAVPAPGG